jgi:phosphoglycerate dehydrogenase-like enzyme
MTRVAITPRSFRSAPGTHHDRLREHGWEAVFPESDTVLTEAEMVRLVAGCDALIVGLDPVTASVLDAGPLRAVVKYGAGWDNIDLEAAQARTVAYGGTPGANARSVAELTLALLLALARHVTYHDRELKAGRHARRTGIELRGRVLGLVGYGAVGREVGRLGHAFGMRVVAHDPYVTELDPDVEPVSLAELLERADVVSLHVPLTDETRGIVDTGALRRMRPGALLINTARGGLVDEEALAAALTTSDGPAGAALDVFTEEHAAASPLLRMDNVIASPHAGAATVEAIERTALAAVDEVSRLLRQPESDPGG